MRTQYLLPLLVSLFFAATVAKAQQTDTAMVRQRANMDSATVSYYNMVLAGSQLKKSRTDKAIAYAVLAAGAGMAILGANPHGEGPNGVFALGCFTMAASNPIFMSAAKAKGRSEILAMDPSNYETQEQKAALIKKYRGNITGCTLGGFVLFLGGLTGLVASIAEESGSGAALSFTTMLTSLPVWMVSAKNRGRLSVITGNYTPSQGKAALIGHQHGIGIALTLGK